MLTALSKLKNAIRMTLNHLTALLHEPFFAIGHPSIGS
jgi:hypothetical protein